jgi:zinc/manganese transport system substrate-binding protein
MRLENRPMRRGALISIVAILALAGALLALLPRVSNGQAGRPKVVATFSVLADLVKQVGGENVEVVALLGPNQDVHVFEPTPADSQTLRTAALVVSNGLELETWLDDLYASSGSTAPRLEAASGLDLIEADEDHDEQGHEEGHQHGNFDPHVWQDPTQVARMVERLRDALAELDPSHAADYQANASRYLGELQTLDAWAAQELARVPAERRKLVTTHEAFGYFARHYDFELIGAVLPVTTEAADPSVGEIAELVSKIKAAGVPTIFGENATNQRLIEQVARAAGVRVAVLYDVLGPAGGPASTYLDMMRYNVKTIADGLGA